MDPFIGEIRLLANNYAPVDWLPCDGNTYQIAQYQALASVIGVIYGGDGRNTFAVPNLQGLVVAAPDTQGQTLPYIDSPGQWTGENGIVLTDSDIPSHTHTISGYTVPAASVINNAQDSVYIARSVGQFDFSNAPANVQMAENVLGPGAGTYAAHENRQPFLALNYYISTAGIYPVRPS